MDGTGEIIKSGAMANLTDLLKTLAGPAFEELGAILADHVRVYRVKNLLRTMEKTKRILQDAGLPPNPVPTSYQTAECLRPRLMKGWIESYLRLRRKVPILVKAKHDVASIHFLRALRYNALRSAVE